MFYKFWHLIFYWFATRSLCCVWAGFCHMMEISCEICRYVLCNVKLFSKQDGILLTVHKLKVTKIVIYLPEMEKNHKHSDGKTQNIQMERRWSYISTKEDVLIFELKITLPVFSLANKHTLTHRPVLSHRRPNQIEQSSAKTRRNVYSAHSKPVFLRRRTDICLFDIQLWCNFGWVKVQADSLTKCYSKNPVNQCSPKLKWAPAPITENVAHSLPGNK